MQKSFLPPIRRGGKPPKYPQMVKNLKIGQFVGGLKSENEQIGCYKAALRMGKFAAIRTVDGDRRVYIISRSEFQKLRGRK